jgi:sigma-B regulation protein RsbU (phosphoserine phosphatase)
MRSTTGEATRWAIREGLRERQLKLRDAIGQVGPAGDLTRLLAEVDSALGRMEDGEYGACEICHEPFDETELLENPMAAYCLCELTPAQQDDLQADLDLAWRIQAALLPRPDLAVGGWEIHYRYQPAGPVSGDYCDVIPPHSPGEDLFFAVGDVSGKGVAAALLMSHLHASLRSHIRLGLPVRELVERASQLLFESTAASQFATLVSGRASSSGEMEISNAGHCPPIRLGSRGLANVESTGFPVGMFGHSPYPVEKLWLEPGETLFFYTDGLTEARDGRDREYGEERLMEVLRANTSSDSRSLANASLADVEAFRGDTPPSDDLTIMVVRRT